MKVGKSERSHLIFTRIAAQIFQLCLGNDFAGDEAVNSTGQTQNLYKFLRSSNMIYGRICSAFGFFL